MEKMDVDEAVVDLSVGAPRATAPAAVVPAMITIEPSTPPAGGAQMNNSSPPMMTPPATAALSTGHGHHSLGHPRRVLRPRTEPRSYAESPDVIINGTLERPRTNGNSTPSAAGANCGGGNNAPEHGYSSDSSEGEVPMIAPIKELSPSELRQRERGLRRLREELRAEEMKLVLLKKLKQSQQLKENVAVLPPSIPQSALPPTGLPSGLSITPTTVKVPSAKGAGGGGSTQGMPQAAHARTVPSAINHNKVGQINNTSVLRGPPPTPRSSLHGTTISSSPISSRASNLSVPQPPPRSLARGGFPPGVKDLPPSVTITPAPPQGSKTAASNIAIGGCSGGGTGGGGGGKSTPSLPEPQQDRSSRGEDNQTPAQRQAAAKLALRKQLEKTLLQIPPPKPPPPEMHFIPNPSNTEFIYLVGLEHVVDFLTKESKPQLPIVPFSCSQCGSDFTPVWKWETVKVKGKAKDHKVICEQCVTTNVKKALKQEHTNRLKTAFVKALQQEQEIEQRLAQNGVFASSSPAPSPVAADVSMPKAATPTPTPRHAATPPAPPSAQQTPPPSRGSHGSSKGGASAAAVAESFNAAAMQALHRQLVQTLQAGGPHAAHMLQFSPLLYPYQLAMAQAASSGKGAPNIADLQRAADIQRQYLLEMIPPHAGGGSAGGGGGGAGAGGGGQRHNWKT